MDGGVPERVAVGRRGGGGRVVQVLVRRTRLRRSVQHQPHHQDGQYSELGCGRQIQTGGTYKNA